MFQFSGFPLHHYEFIMQWLESVQPGFPIRKSADHRICAPSRSLSQLVTSFFGSQCQGIHPALFLLNRSDSPLACGVRLLGSLLSLLNFLSFRCLPIQRFNLSIESFLFGIRFLWCFPNLMFGSGDEGIRTPDPLLARQVLSQLSYTPTFAGFSGYASH